MKLERAFLKGNIMFIPLTHPSNFHTVPYCTRSALLLILCHKAMKQIFCKIRQDESQHKMQCRGCQSSCRWCSLFMISGTMSQNWNGNDLFLNRQSTVYIKISAFAFSACGWSMYFIRRWAHFVLECRTPTYYSVVCWIFVCVCVCVSKGDVGPDGE